MEGERTGQELWEATDLREVCRYLGYRQVQPDQASGALIESCLEELAEKVSPRFFSRAYPLRLLPGGQVDFTCFQTVSRSLSKNLRDCREAILFAATLGAGVDLLLRRYTAVRMSRAVVMQAAGAAMIEAYCNLENRRLKEEAEEKGLYLRPRFSPGYGDFSLECQRPLTEALEAEKRVGITLTDSFLMLPSKSVTAVIGVGETKTGCNAEGCEACGKTDCLYRR